MKGHKCIAFWVPNADAERFQQALKKRSARYNSSVKPGDILRPAVHEFIKEEKIK